MLSPIKEEAAGTVAFPSRSTEAPGIEHDLPVTIPTPATETAPKGRIIDDSARGTIFWEAFSDDDDKPIEDAQSEHSAEVSIEPDEVAAQSFGKPFQIEWLSTTRLPFYRTRGLRNPWNANREVKIARDGTEIEPNVGRKLIQMFHRPFQGPPAGRPVPPPQTNPVGGFQRRQQY